MHVLLDSGDYHFSNMGDVAMLQVAVARLLEIWPSASIDVLTQDSAALAKYLPGAFPLSWHGRSSWMGRGALLGPLEKVARRVTPPGSPGIEGVLRQRRPRLFSKLVRTKFRARGHPTAELDEFVTALEGADAVVVCGAGGITDHAAAWMVPMLEFVGVAARRRIPTAMFSQGIGPLRDPTLRSVLGRVLPKVNLLALRESEQGPVLLRELGISLGDRLLFTGDDAIELAYGMRPSALGTELGLNLRVARSAHTDGSLVGLLREPIQRFAREHGVTVLPLPIGRSSTSDDAAAIRELLAGYDDSTDGGSALDSPARLIEQAGRCRAVVTGAYHAAVFALSQGVPTVCLARAPYFSGKFHGLAKQFGEGCSVVDLQSASAAADVYEALSWSWDRAPDLHEPLLEAARVQITASRAAYRRFGELVEKVPA
jgi:colanic acid/amylovoran biosynthesis protein